MKWETVKLEECCVSITDGDHQAPPRAETGIPFIIISDINQFNQIDFTNARFVPIDYFDALDIKRKPQNGDLLYTVKGSFGIPVYVDSNEPFVFQRDIAILKCNEKMNSKFLFYVMKSNAFYQIADALAIGSAQRAITLNTLKNMRVPMPSLSEQARIVQMLEPYDSLIENNQKQIKLLEEAAQRLYKEWFIDLRFPGYETTPVHGGVPEGWFWGTVDEVIEYHDKKRKPLSSTERAQFQGNYKYYGAAGVLDHVKEYLFDGIFLLFGEDGTVITPDGYPVLQYVRGQFWVNNHAHVLTGKACYSTEYIYMMFKNIKVSDVVTGVAQPKISQARLSAKKILIPERELVLTYSEIIKPYMQMNLALQEQNEQLIEARDRLLPKLMSGEIEV